MKKLTAFLLAISILVSISTVFAYAEHTHKAGVYSAGYTDLGHVYICKDCGTTVTEPHELDKSGKCACGYVDHTHSAGTYSAGYTDWGHVYVCKDCGTTVTEPHELGESGKCACGYVDHTHKAFGYMPSNLGLGHIYLCIDCGTSVVEPHDFAENGRCDCGYVDVDNADVITILLQPFDRVISYFKYYISVFVVSFKYGYRIGSGM